MNTSCVIIGGGLGGLFCGAFLAKNGIEVTVLEKNAIIGGGLQCFKRNNTFFETGIHTIGGFKPNQTLYKICDYLGIINELKFHHINNTCMDEIRILDSGKVYHIPSGKDAFTKKLCEYFPNESQNIKAYVKEIFELSEEVPLFNLKENRKIIDSHSEKFFWSVDRFISHFVQDQELRHILAYMSPLYGGVPGHTPVYIHSLINVLYINGASRFMGGSQQLANALKRVIENNAGNVISNIEVTGCNIHDSRIYKLHTNRNLDFKADYFISAICPSHMLNLFPNGALGKLYEKRIKEIPYTYSAFSVFIKFKPKSFKFISHTCHIHNTLNDIWGPDSNITNSEPSSLYYLTPADKPNQLFASRMIIINLMNFKEVEQWANSVTGHRCNDYYLWKKQRESKIIKILERIYPGFINLIDSIESASPLTIRDFYHSKDGSLYGFQKDCEDFFLSQLSIKTKLKNLFLTGQNVNLHGICGVPLTAISTAENILGTNSILNQFSNNEK